MKIQNQSKTRFLTRTSRLEAKSFLLVLFPFSSRFFPVVLPNLQVLVPWKACHMWNDQSPYEQGQTINPQILVRLVWRKLLENKDMPSTQPCVQRTCHSREEGPQPFRDCNATFGFPTGLSLKVCLLSLVRAGAQSTPDLKDGNVVVAVILRQQGDLWPLPGWQVWVADLEVSAVKLEQSEHFDFYFKGVSKNKHIDLQKRGKRVHKHPSPTPVPQQRRERVLLQLREEWVMCLLRSTHEPLRGHLQKHTSATWKAGEGRGTSL